MASTPTKKRLRQMPRKRAVQRVSDMTVDELRAMIQSVMHRQFALHARPDGQAWKIERAFIQGLINQGPVPGRRNWTREELYDR